VFGVADRYTCTVRMYGLRRVIVYTVSALFRDELLNSPRSGLNGHRASARSISPIAHSQHQVNDRYYAP
jgi:hypothetical protein